MDCLELKCRTKTDITMYLATILACFLCIPVLSLIKYSVDAVKVLLGFLALALVHEYLHYMALKIMGKKARIAFFVRYGALFIDYIDELMWNEVLYTALAPQILITLPLSLLYKLTKDIHIYVLMMLHIVASTPDLVNSIKLVTVFKNHKFRLCREGKRVLGYITLDPSGRCTMYKL